MFGNDFFLQVSGVSMGSRMSPSFASTYVGRLEHDVLLNPQRNPYLQHMVSYKRYIDDVFFIWTSTEDKLRDFHCFLNSQDEHLKFTISHDKCQMNFLDILVCNNDGSLSTSLYRKPTDRNSLLHGQSYHPLALKKSLPISQLNRVRRICSSDTDFKQQQAALETRFLQRGHKREWVTEASRRFDGVSQTDCLTSTRDKTNDGRILCAIPFSPLSKEMSTVIQKHWHIVATDPSLKKLTSPPRIVFKRPPNLRDMLVRTDNPPYPPPTSSRLFSPLPSGNYKCGKCAQCHFTKKSHTFTHPQSGKSIPIKGVICCSTPGVIYMLRCQCGLCYIGKTSRPLKTRISEHRSAIRNHDVKSPVAVHFTKMKHTVSSLFFLGIEQVKLPRRGGDLNTLLLKRELFYIFSLGTLAPKGLNEEMDIRPFL